MGRKAGYGGFVKGAFAAVGTVAILAGASDYITRQQEEPQATQSQSAPEPVQYKKPAVDRINKDAFLDYLNASAADIDEFRSSSNATSYTDSFPDQMENFLRDCCLVRERRLIDVNNDGEGELLISATRRPDRVNTTVIMQRNGNGYKDMVDLVSGQDPTNWEIYKSSLSRDGYNNLFAFGREDGENDYSLVIRLEHDGTTYKIARKFILPEGFGRNIEVTRRSLAKFPGQRQGVWSKIGYVLGPLDALKMYMAVEGTQVPEGEDFLWSTISLARYAGINPLEYKNKPAGFYSALFDRLTQTSNTAPVASATANRNVDKAAYDIATYYDATTDPDMINSYLSQLQGRIGTVPALQALTLVKAGSTYGNIYPQDPDEFRRVAEVIEKKKNLPAGSVTRDIADDLYRDEVRSFAIGGPSLLSFGITALGVSIDAARSTTGQTKYHEAIDVLIEANTKEGEMARGWRSRHGRDPVPSELRMSVLTNSIPEGPRAPNANYVTSEKRSYDPVSGSTSVTQTINPYGVVPERTQQRDAERKQEIRDKAAEQDKLFRSILGNPKKQ